jgi:ABC-type Mn/Zn transport systems, ATPase component
MQPTPLVTLNQAGIQVSGRWLVKDVSFSVAPSEIVTLIGPNGSGKSTTAKLALGILKPSQGQATRRAGLRVAYVPQQLAIDWTLPLNVSQFLQLTGALSGEEIHDAVAACGLQSPLDAEVRTLSGGEFQRVLLARAIAKQPELLVLDEPVQGVDFAGENALYQLISEIRDALHCGILLISHDLHVVMAQTDRVLCLNGHVCCSGTPTAVAASEEFQTLFGLRAENQLAVYTHHHDHEHASTGAIQPCEDHHVG